ncbi:MAG: hypothetical protein J5490_05790 [Bacteroidales bacterium]|nr:hypothetical protein [Bacteroidales bacterium]
MIKKKIVLLLGVLFVISSCLGFGGAATPEAHEISFIPGECLKSCKLQPAYYDAPTIIGAPTTDEKVPFWIYTAHRPKSLAFSLEMDLDIKMESFSGFIASDYRYCPSDNIFKSFGDSSKLVKNEYETAYESIKNSPDWVTHSLCLSSIYYCGGMVITASDDFAGIPAGENIASIAEVYNYDSDRRLPFINVPEGYISLGRFICVLIPMEDRQIVEDVLKISIEIPVKVGLFLNYLMDKRTNPDATMQFRDEVLICEFTVSRGLK